MSPYTREVWEAMVALQKACAEHDITLEEIRLSGVLTPSRTQHETSFGKFTVSEEYEP